MSEPLSLIRIDPRDNVAVALRPIAPGERCQGS